MEEVNQEGVNQEEFNELELILAAKLDKACRTRDFNTYFRTVDDHIYNKLLPANYMSEKNGKFMGKFFECWQAAKQNAVRFLTHTGMHPTNRTQYQRICNIIVAAEDTIDFIKICRMKSSSNFLAHSACTNGNTHLMRLIFEMNDKATLIDLKGWIFFTLAMENGQIEIIRLLLEYGMKVNEDIGCDLPLCAAAMKGHVGVVQFLLENGANINLTAPNGVPALQQASMGGHVEVVRVLLANGARISHSAKMCAKNSEIREVLEQTEEERAQRKQEAKIFLALGKRGSGLFRNMPENAQLLIPRMITAASTPRAV